MAYFKHFRRKEHKIRARIAISSKKKKSTIILVSEKLGLFNPCWVVGWFVQVLFQTHLQNGLI